MMHVITGGSGSGKSAYAEMWLTGNKKNGTNVVSPCSYVYIATMRPFGAETQKKIERHRKMRAGKGFQTLECYGDLRMLDEKLQYHETAGILLECISNLLADVLYLEDGSLREDEEVLNMIVEGIRYLNKKTDRLVIVTNEVHSDVQDYSAETRKYIELLGRINQELGNMADQVTEVVYGIPVKIK